MRMTLIQAGVLALVFAGVHADYLPTTRYSEQLNNCRTTDACPEHCESCTENGTCCACSPGWHGATCNQTCHINCYTCTRNGECDTCNNRHVFGPLCEQPGDLCLDGMSSRSRCTRGCVDGYFEAPLHELNIKELGDYYKCVKCPALCTSCTSEGHCNSCVHRRWGETCNKRCPRSCKRCHKHTGECLDDHCGWGRFNDSAGQCQNCPEPCRSCTSESQCTRCLGQRYGAMCEHVNCSSITNCSRCHCTSLLCDDIKCTKCESGYAGDRCQVNITVEETSSQANTSQPTSTVAYQNEALPETEDAGMDTTSTVLFACIGVIVLAILGIAGYLYLAKQYSWRTPCSMFNKKFSNEYCTKLCRRCSHRPTDLTGEDLESIAFRVNVLAPDSLDRTLSNGQLAQV